LTTGLFAKHADDLAHFNAAIATFVWIVIRPRDRAVLKGGAIIGARV